MPENKLLDSDEQVMDLVEMTLTLPPEEREAYLKFACGEDSALLRKVLEYVSWDNRMQGFLLDPLYPHAPAEPRFQAGDMLDGRFRILREVAQGGMGVVYEAVDEKLERRIAIKCAKTGFSKRLPPEVRHASDVSHPNVCKIFEIHTASTDTGEIDFFTMEFVEGETLAERLRRGPLPDPEARLIARQLCEGMAAAHKNGVVHGDLKSNNIILNGAGENLRAVITDFGLARRAGGTQLTSLNSEAGGTPDYMAPELWKGAKASVTSDIYALGIIFYEMASGRRPHAPDVSLEARLTRKPPPVNPKWDRILGRCLDADPERRFSSADEILRAFQPSLTRRWVAAAAAAVLLAAITGVIATQRAAAPKQSVRLAMLPLEASDDLRSLAGTLSSQTGERLAHLTGGNRVRLTVLPASTLLNQKVDTPEKALAAAGATHVLRGRLERQGGKVLLHAYLTDTHSLTNTREWKVAYRPTELRYAPDALAGVATFALKLPLLATVAVNAAALQDYTDGLARLRRNSGADAALGYLERAVAEDPDSPLTYAALAEAQWIKYVLTERDPVWVARAKESVEQAVLRNPDLAPVHRIAGLLQSDGGWYEEASGEYQRAIELEPQNGDAYRRLASVYESTNQLDEALAAYRRAIEADPQSYRNHQGLGAFYSKRSDYNEAAKYFQKAVSLAPDEPDTHYALATAFLNLGRFGESESELRYVISLRETPKALNSLGLALMFQGKDKDAIPYMNQALKSSELNYRWWTTLGIAYRRVHLTADAEQANRRGLAIVEAELQKNPRSGYARAFLAYLCARLGDKARAESEIGQALRLSPNDADVRWSAALTYEALGRREDTIAVLEQSPYEVLAEVSRWPDVADLRQDSRFIQLLASRNIR